MRLQICAVGRLKAGPERDLFDDYRQRADRTGRGIGLGPLDLAEIDPRKGGGMAGEAALLQAAIMPGAVTVALDERGRTLSSPKFAERLGGWRDEGRPAVAFVIGGADGLAPDMRDAADLVLSFGAMVWPHMLARVMLAEQVYRATGILAGTPYHRE